MWSALVLIFDEQTWFTLFFTIFALLFAMHRISYVNFAKYKESEHLHYQTLQGSLLTIISILVAKDFIKNPRTTCLRMIILTWAYSAMVLYSVHSSNLARNCIHPQYEKRIKLDTIADTDFVFASSLFGRPYLTVFNESVEKVREKPLKTYYCRDAFVCLEMLKNHR